MRSPMLSTIALAIYTSVPNILKVLNPLFLDDLRGQLEQAGDNPRMLLNLRKRMSKIRVFDPACGSGNFLVISYKEMRATDVKAKQVEQAKVAAAEQERLADEKAATERAAAIKAEADKAVEKRLAIEKAAAEEFTAEKLVAEKAISEKVAAEAKAQPQQVA